MSLVNFDNIGEGHIVWHAKVRIVLNSYMDTFNIRSLLTSFEVYEDIRSLGDVIKGINLSALTSKHS